MKYKFGTTEHFNVLTTKLNNVDTEAPSFNLSTTDYADALNYNKRMARLVFSDKNTFNKICENRFETLKGFNLYEDSDYFTDYQRNKQAIIDEMSISFPAHIINSSKSILEINNAVKSKMIETHKCLIDNLKKIENPERICENYAQIPPEVIKENLFIFAYELFGDVAKDLNWFSEPEMDEIINIYNEQVSKIAELQLENQTLQEKLDKINAIKAKQAAKLENCKETATISVQEPKVENNPPVTTTKSSVINKLRQLFVPKTKT